MARLKKCFKKSNAKSRKPYDVTISMGVISFNDHPEDSFEKLMSRADKKLYQHKQRKKALKEEKAIVIEN